jgi:hypothetical protein
MTGACRRLARLNRSMTDASGRAAKWPFSAGLRRSERVRTTPAVNRL